MQCPNCRQVEDGEWLYANGCCRYYEEEAIHCNFLYAQDADQSYQPGQAAIHVPMYPQQQFNYLHHHCHPQLSLSFENIEWVPGGGNKFSYSIDVILTVCLGEHGNMRSATYIHPYVDGDGKSLLMCTKDRQTFPPIETPAIPPPAMPATPQLVDQISNNRCISLVELTHGLFSIIPFCMYFLHVMLSSTIHTSNGELQKISSTGRILHSTRRVQFL
ncbi:hypothetical protein BDL97_10G110700 [Sphagnum fallax]|nr:hypothetical protein BDL97_10G110700 [Sphagnum fallax]